MNYNVLLLAIYMLYKNSKLYSYLSWLPLVHVASCLIPATLEKGAVCANS